ncbi:MAG: ABC transporter permease [Alsobacter sp.]
MLAFVVRRLAAAAFMLLLISLLVFAGINATPGDPVSQMISPERAAGMSQERLDELRRALGLGRPFYERYGLWLVQALQGNFGFSMTSGVAVRDVVLDRLPATLELSMAALLFSSVAGLGLGVMSALRRGTATDLGLTVVGMIGVSVPEFFFGLAAISIFSLHLGWLPVGGRSMPGHVTFLDRLPHLILPAAVLSIMMTAGVMRYARAAMLDTMQREFIKTARAKGLPEWRVNVVHGLRVALSPVIVLIGFRFPILIGGSVVIEQVFQWPGVGSLFVSAVRARDYPLVMFIAMLSALAVLLLSLAVDVLTGLLDPRVRLEG